ncbi:Heat shock protein 75 kDa, mitochondrial [Sciurus carolinensis]|uniref:Heat shock protein 75 kDa, mitochondrial n=1 Tax=Sciurus carolinensis TaxID=30640 RepID=A0AA41SYS3_SCICA|nr:Heat shock protein 75 kDa, mitochondrial [Sciurus carolinensis]
MHSLYSEKEVFIHELISNASDALEKLHHKLVSDGQTLLEMEIHLQTDAEKGTITSQDTSIGMAQEELVSNLGTIVLLLHHWTFNKPRYTLHYRTNAPLNIRSLFYVPEMKPSMFDVSGELDSSMVLYSHKVLIQTKAVDILRKWLRFIRGVVDSEKIPLNLSWKLLQESALIRKLQDVLQQRLMKFFVEQSKRDAEKYAKFFEDYSLFMREGTVTTAGQEVKEDIAKLLSYTHPAMVIVLEIGAAQQFLCMQQLAKTQEEHAQLLQPTLEVDPRHTLIRKLSQLREPESELAQMLVDQIYGNAVIAAGLVNDPRPMVGCLNDLVKALERC